MSGLRHHSMYVCVVAIVQITELIFVFNMKVICLGVSKVFYNNTHNKLDSNDMAYTNNTIQ